MHCHRIGSWHLILHLTCKTYGRYYAGQNAKMRKEYEQRLEELKHAQVCLHVCL